MNILKNRSKEKIHQAISEVETKSSCELVAVLTQKSSNYTTITLLLASLITILLPAFLLLWKPYMEALHIYEIQVVTFAITYLLFSIDNVQQILIPKKILHKQASAKAYESFMALGLNQTTNNQGVMIFVSIFEHFVEIIVDSGVSHKLPNSIWQNIIDEFITDVKNGNFEEGYIEAIQAIGEILKVEFPIQKNDKNELSNHFVEI
jgi:putative membrane protein